MILKAFHYRLYPNLKQQEMFAKHFGCARFVWNWALEKKTRSYAKDKKCLSVQKLITDLPNLKTSNPWLKEINSQSLQSSLINLDTAFSNFFRRLADPEVKEKGYPVFKERKGRQSFHCPQNVKIDFERNKISLPKIRDIKTKFSRKFEGKVNTVTISRTPANRYFVSILVENIDIPPQKPKIDRDQTIGIDLGLKDFAILSTGEKIPNPKFNYQKENKHIKRLNRRISRQYEMNEKHTKNRHKNCVKRAKLFEKESNRRKDFHHKVSSKLVRENQTICLEDLNITGLMKNHKVAESFASVGLSTFVNYLKYKCEWYGKNLIFINRFDPSSRICNCCGYYNHDLKLGDRTWKCPQCQTILDRDVNAAKNIKDFALQKQNLIGQVPHKERQVPVKKNRFKKKENKIPLDKRELTLQESGPLLTLREGVSKFTQKTKNESLCKNEESTPL